jgi:hypothetical protein
MYDTTIMLKPREQWPAGMTHDKLIQQMETMRRAGNTSWASRSRQESPKGGKAADGERSLSVMARHGQLWDGFCLGSLRDPERTGTAIFPTLPFRSVLCAPR